jgi:hypothetical protein
MSGWTSALQHITPMMVCCTEADSRPASMPLGREPPQLLRHVRQRPPPQAVPRSTVRHLPESLVAGSGQSSRAAQYPRCDCARTAERALRPGRRRPGGPVLLSVASAVVVVWMRPEWSISGHGFEAVLDRCEQQWPCLAAAVPMTSRRRPSRRARSRAPRAQHHLSAIACSSASIVHSESGHRDGLRASRELSHRQAGDRARVPHCQRLSYRRLSSAMSRTSSSPCAGAPSGDSQPLKRRALCRA